MKLKRNVLLRSANMVSAVCFEDGEAHSQISPYKIKNHFFEVFGTENISRSSSSKRLRNIILDFDGFFINLADADDVEFASKMASHLDHAVSYLSSKNSFSDKCAFICQGVSFNTKSQGDEADLNLFLVHLRELVFITAREDDFIGDDVSFCNFIVSVYVNEEERDFLRPRLDSLGLGYDYDEEAGMFVFSE